MPRPMLDRTKVRSVYFENGLQIDRKEMMRNKRFSTGSLGVGLREKALRCHELMKHKLTVFRDSLEYIPYLRRDELMGVIRSNLLEFAVFKHDSQMVEEISNTIFRSLSQMFRTPLDTENSLSVVPDTYLYQTDKVMAYLKQQIIHLNSETSIIQRSKNTSWPTNVFSSEDPGPRSFMEDKRISIFQVEKLYGYNSNVRSMDIFAILDGHAGYACLNFVNSNLVTQIFEFVKDWDTLEEETFIEMFSNAIIKGFESTESLFQEHADKYEFESGTCVSIIFLITSNAGDRLLITANVGDARVIIKSKSGEISDLSENHRPTAESEKKRIHQSGGTVVYWMGQAKVNAIVGVCRSIGDRKLKDLLIPTPYISSRMIKRNDDYIVMASDGIWEVLKPSKICNIIEKARNEPNVDFAKLCIQEAKKGNLQDNVAIQIVFL